MTPDLYGLVLAGGKSRRMGRDKGLIPYHGVPHREYTASLLEQFCSKTYISINASQFPGRETQGYLTDRYPDSGPLGAILTAHEYFPKVAWLIAPCDMPDLDGEILKFLISERSPDKAATCFKNKDGFIEPLLSIYEPVFLHTISHAFQKGERSPSKLLRQADIQSIISPWPERMGNLNEPE